MNVIARGHLTFSPAYQIRLREKWFMPTCKSSSIRCCLLEIQTIFKRKSSLDSNGVSCCINKTLNNQEGPKEGQKNIYPHTRHLDTPISHNDRQSRWLLFGKSRETRNGSDSRSPHCSLCLCNHLGRSFENKEVEISITSFNEIHRESAATGKEI